MSKALATNVAAAVLVLGALVSTFAFAAPATAQSATDLQAQVNALLAQLASLQGGSTTMAATSCNTFTRNHSVGNVGGEVMWIQQFLNKSASTQISMTGAGSPGMETSSFGAKTKAAVMKFQAANGISPVSGYWGPLTRAKANSMCTTSGTTGGTTGGTVIPSGPGLSVMAGVQPANTLAPGGASRVPFTTFSITNNSGAAVTINGVTVQRTGLANDAVFDGVVLVDSNGLQVGVSRTFNSNHQAIIGETLTIPAGASQTFTVAGNISATNAATYTGQVASISVVGINTTAPVAGSLPISGAQQTINSTLSLGNVTPAISSFDPNGVQSKNIGDTGIKFTGVRFTAGSAEDVKMYSVRFRQAGTIGSGDLGNLMVYVDGTSYPVSWSADGKYVNVVFPGGILIQKGLSKDVYIMGDIVGSNVQGRSVQFDIDKTSDVYFVGQLYGYGVSLVSTTNGSSGTGTSIATASQPWFDGSLFNLTGASITTISKANEVPAQNVALNVPNQPLGGFVTDIKGESIQVQNMVFQVNYGSSAASGNLLTNVSIVDSNGAVVAGPVDGVVVAGTNQKLTFTDTVTFKPGRSVYTLKGKLPSTISNNETVTASSTPSSAWTNVLGVTSGNTVSLSGSGVFTMNMMTIRAATLSATLGTTPAAQTQVAGSQDVLMATYQFDASNSGEDVRFSTIPYSSTLTLANLSNCRVFDGATNLTTGSNSVSVPAATGSFTLDNSVTVAKGTVKTLTVKCNINSGATGTSNIGLGAPSGMSATGVTSSNTVTVGGVAATGVTMTIGTATLAVTLDSSSPSYGVAAANTTGVTLAAFKFRATNDSVNLERIGLTLSGTGASSADLSQVTLWANGSQIGTATFTGSNMRATSTLTTTLSLAKDTDVVVTVKGNLSAIGPSEAVTVSGHTVKVDIDTNGAAGNGNTKGTGAGSGTGINASGTTAVSGVQIYKSVPTFTYSTTGATANNGTNDLIAITVAADAKGEIQLNKLTFALSTTTATLSAPTFSGPNGNVASTTNVNLNAAGTMVTVYFDSLSNTQDRLIPAGGSKTFTLRGTVSLTGVNSTGSVGVALKADTSSSVISTVATLEAASRNLIWSPSSNGSALVGATDWANGYGLGGCFTTAGLGNDCTVRTISK